MSLAADAGSEKVATFRINIKQGQISDVSSGHTKPNRFLAGRAEFHSVLANNKTNRLQAVSPNI